MSVHGVAPEHAWQPDARQRDPRTNFIFNHWKKTVIVILKSRMQNEVEALKQHRLLQHKKKFLNNNLEHKCLIILTPITDQMWEQDRFFFFFSVTFVLSNLFVFHVTPDTCLLSHSLLRRDVIIQRMWASCPVVDAAARARVLTLPWFWSACSLSSAALLMIAGPLVTDWQLWAGCTRSHLTGRSLTTPSCSSPLHPAGSTHPT